MENYFFAKDLFADVMSVHNRNMKHARAIEFDETNLLAVLRGVTDGFSQSWKFMRRIFS